MLDDEYDIGGRQKSSIILICHVLLITHGQLNEY